MKKILLSVSLILTAIVGYSQAKFEIGLKVGANFANTSIGDINSDGITSFHGGAFFLVKLGNIGIQPEVLYSSQGTKVSGGKDVNLDYINIPLMLKFYLPAGINIQVGPQFGLLSDDLTDLNGDGTDEQLKKSDISVVGGLGIDFPFGLKIDARYIYGLSDINNDPSFQGDVKNRTFQVSVGYSLFKIGR